MLRPPRERVQEFEDDADQRRTWKLVKSQKLQRDRSGFDRLELRGSFAIMFVFYFESGYRHHLEKTEPMRLASRLRPDVFGGVFRVPRVRDMLRVSQLGFTEIP